MKVMILAAGEGTRLRPHTLKLPKPSIPFLGSPLAYYSLSLFQDPKNLDLVINTFHLPEKVKHTYEGIRHKVNSIQFSDESGAILGSGGGLKKAQPLIQTSESFFMLNADEVLIPQEAGLLERAYEYHLQSKNIATLLVMKHPLVGVQFGGVWTNQQKILGFGKTPYLPGAEPWHFLGIQILSPEIFAYLPEGKESNILYDGVTLALRDGKQAGIFEVSAHWYETGNPQDFLKATRECLKHYANQDPHFLKFWQTQELFRSEKFHLHRTNTSTCLVAESSLHSISQVRPEGFCVIGSNLSCMGEVQINNSVVGDDQRLLPGEKIVETILI